jgi:hypothetical protein
MPWSRLQVISVTLGDLPPCGAAALLGGKRSTCKHLRDHCVDLGALRGSTDINAFAKTNTTC